MQVTPKARPRQSLSLEQLDDRIVPALPTLLGNVANPITLSGANSTWDYSDGNSFTPSPVFADVDGVAGEELITVTGDRKVVAYKWGGGTVANPVFTLLRTYDTGVTPPELHTTPLVVSLPSGKAIFVGGLDGRVFAWNASTGAKLPGWPATVDVPDNLDPQANLSNQIYGHLAAGDLDGDGIPEIVATSFNHNVTALRADGSVMWRFSDDDTVLSGVAIGDIDRDGRNDVVMSGDASQNAAYDAGGNIVALSGEGRRKWTKHVGQIGQSSPVLVDINGDGKLEIFAGTGINFVNLNGVPFPGNEVNGLDSNGNNLPGWPYNTGPNTGNFRTPSPPAVADLDGDGIPEIIIGDYSGQIHAIKANGSLLWKVQAFDTPLFAAPLVADIDGDGHLDVIQLTYSQVRAFNGLTGANTWNSFVENGFERIYLNSPAIGNFKGDGTLQLAIMGNGTISGGPPKGPSSLRFFDVPASTIAPAWVASRGDATGDIVLRSNTFATNYLTKLATYLGRDANGAPGLISAWSTTFRHAPGLDAPTGAIVGSVEGRYREIRSWYTRFLDRTADQGGLDTWLNFLNQGNTFATAESLVLGSQEAFNKSGPNGPNSATNSTWTTYLYQRVLGRTPSSGEVAGWANALNAGQLTRPQVAIGFLLSREYTQNLVQQWYNTYRFGGTATAPADSLFAAAFDLRRGVTEETVLRRLMTQGMENTTSDYLTTTTDGTWLRAIYKDVLKRPLSASDAIYWLQQRETGMSLETIATIVLNSTERNNMLVTGWYRTYLHRAGNPTAAEIAPHVTRLVNGERREVIIADLMSSQEYYNFAGSTTDGLIYAVYADVLGPGRTPEPAALTYWRTRPDVRSALPTYLLTVDEYYYHLTRAWFFEYLLRYENTPSNYTVVPNPPGSDPFAPVRAFISYLQAGGQQSFIEYVIVTSPEYFAIALSKAFWAGTRWKT